MGKLVGNIVQRPYHGLQFDSTGKCVKVPSRDRVLASAKVKGYFAGFTTAGAFPPAMAFLQNSPSKV